MPFLSQFTAWHFVALVLGACFTTVAAWLGRRIAKKLEKLITTLESLGITVHKTEILWERQADVRMFQELERRQKAGA